MAKNLSTRLQSGGQNHRRLAALKCAADGSQRLLNILAHLKQMKQQRLNSPPKHTPNHACHRERCDHLRACKVIAMRSTVLT